MMGGNYPFPNMSWRLAAPALIDRLFQTAPWLIRRDAQRFEDLPVPSHAFSRDRNREWQFFCTPNTAGTNLFPKGNGIA
jgi:hypothetical protein